MQAVQTKPEKLQGLGEEIANAVSHGAGALLGIAATTLMIIRAAKIGPLAVVSVCIYGASLILMYTISCLYHALAAPRAKHVFRILDHCTIFALIAGTYMPISLVNIGGVTGWLLFGTNLAIAAVGIPLNAINLKKWSKISVGLYVAMGWLVVMAFGKLLHSISTAGLVLLVIGGVMYTLGLIAYRMKRKYMHFIWHLFVLAGSVFQFFAVYGELHV